MRFITIELLFNLVSELWVVIKKILKHICFATQQIKVVNTFCMLGVVLEAGDVADEPLDIEELESWPHPGWNEIENTLRKAL